MPFTPTSTGGASTPGGRRRDSSLGGKEVNVSLDISADGKEELLRLKQENEMLRHRLAEVEGNWRKATDNAKALQTVQQRLFQVHVDSIQSGVNTKPTNKQTPTHPRTGPGAAPREVRRH